MKKTLLWQITPADGSPASYLFGTMHVRDTRAFGWLEKVKPYIDQATAFATEFDFRDLDETALNAVMRLPGDKSLAQLLPKGAWKQLQFAGQKHLNTPAEFLKWQHPMVVSTALTGAILGTESLMSLDETLWHYAREQEKHLLGVETFNDQLRTVERIPLEMHLKSLVWLLKNKGSHRRKVHKMLHWYQAGDLKKLFKAAKRDAKGMRRILLTDRNVRMAHKFKETATETSLFCAVGAGHLAGKNGLLRLLKKQGFKIKPVMLTTQDLQ